MEENDDFDFSADPEFQEADGKVKELAKLQTRTPEQEEELKTFKQKRQRAVNSRFGELNRRTREAEERAARIEQELQELRTKPRQEAALTGDENEQYEINGKKFFTDEALQLRVAAGKMTQAAAWKMQKDAIREEAIADIEKRNTEKSTKQIQDETFNEVYKEYPQFLDTRHPKFNPNDPLYLEAKRLMDNGYRFNPRGLKLALEDAKKNLGKTNTRPDLSDDLSVAGTSAATERSQRGKTVELSEWEQDNAYAMWRNKVNPTTGKLYSRQEAVSKALAAKKQRQELLATR